MYLRVVHSEHDVPTLQKFVQDHPLGLFTTALPHAEYSTIQTSHIPMILDKSSGQGILRGHMARANPQCKAILDRLRPTDSQHLDEEVLVLFNSPFHSYVTPRFYTETKPASGKVVPTWDYAAVQVYGKLKAYHANDEETSEFLQSQMEALTSWGESQYPPANGGAWKVSDAPDKYIAWHKKGVIGFEIEITRIEGKFKMSQENPEGDWKGVVDGFAGLQTVNGTHMSQMVENRGKERPSTRNLTCPIDP